MSKPIPGKQYTVKTGDTLSSIAAMAYGDGNQWTRIKKANAGRVFWETGSNDKLSPGNVLTIPADPVREKLRSELTANRLSNRDADQMTLIVDNMEIPIMAGKVLRTMDTASDSWTASLAWVPGENPELDERLKPFGYKQAAVYLGNELMVNGLLYTVGVEFSGSGCVKNLTGYSFTADMIDSVLSPPYEHNNVTFMQLSAELVKPLGLKFEMDDSVVDDSPFDRVTAESTDTIFSHLAKLATQRGFLISSTNSGNPIILKAKTSGAPVATLEEGKPPVLDFSATFDGRTRFNIYRCVGQSPLDYKEGIAKDTAVPRSRFITFQADDTITGGVQQSAEWKRSKQLADALEIPLPVSSWQDPEGRYWKENTLITVKSPALHIPDGFTFLIRSVEFSYETSGTPAVLNLVPPQVYSGEMIKEPWL